MEKHSLGYRLAEARRNVGLSQLEAAQACGCHTNSISNYERGRRVPRPRILTKLASIYKVPIIWLQTGHYNTLGERLGLARLQAGLEQNTVAEDLGWRVRMVQQFEDGTKVPNYTQLARLSAVYNQPLQVLLTDASRSGDEPAWMSVFRKLSPDSQKEVERFVHYRMSLDDPEFDAARRTLIHRRGRRAKPPRS